MIRLILIGSIALALSSCMMRRAQAAPQVSCAQVRAYVASYGREMVESIARQQGISNRDIGRALGCLKGRHARQS